MKRYGQLFDTFVSFSNLLIAYKKARKGAVGKRETQQFSFYLEKELFFLQDELMAGNYQPRPYRYFKIHDPKERTISVAAFRDRVVHHALINILEPIYEKSFIYDSYATRKEKGTHRAVHRAQSFLRQTGWFWKADINKYFDSIQQSQLIDLLERKIKDVRLLDISSRIIQNGGENGRGLPIGNLTSQFFANVYLNGFDHFLKETLGVKHYLRYMDDFVLFHQDKAKVKSWRQTVKEYLHHQLDLQIKEKASYLNSAANGLTFLGRRIFPSAIRIARPNARRMIRRMAKRKREFQNGTQSEEKYVQSMNSYWAQLADFPLLRKQLLRKV